MTKVTWNGISTWKAGSICVGMIKFLQPLYCFVDEGDLRSFGQQQSMLQAQIAVERALNTLFHHIIPVDIISS